MEPELFIDEGEDLKALCRRLQGSPWLALDTEFIREKTYYPRLCLLQIANKTTVACIDALALSPADLEPLLSLLHDPMTIKVFHSARQDLEIFYYLEKRVPAPLFDTQIAAALLGYGDQIGYGALVKEVLGVTLPKAHSRTDWSLRPLEKEQLRYAADDVRYLRDLYRELREQLQSLGRLAWLEEDFAALANPESYAIEPRSMWRRVRGHQYLKSEQLAILRELAAWREEKAQQLDKPRKWLLRDDLLLEIARRAPRNQQALARVRGADSGSMRRWGEEILARVEAALHAPAESWPRPGGPPALSEEQEGLVDALMALVKLCALESRVGPASLVTRKELERLVRGERQLAVMRGWRKVLCGARLEAFLDGDIALTVKRGRLVQKGGGGD